MKILRHILYAVCILLLCSGCLGLTQEGTSVRIKLANESDSELVVDYKECYVDVEFTSSVSSWKVDSDSEWCNAEDASESSNKSGNYILRVSLTENPSDDPREATITISAYGTSVKIKVTQAGVGILEADKDTVVMPSNGGDCSIILHHTDDYEYTMEEIDWINVESILKGEQSDTLNFKISKNESYDSRETEIIFKGDFGRNDNVKIVQLQNNAIIAAQNKYDVGYEAGSLSFTISSNIEYTVESDSDWLTYIETKALQDKEIRVEYEENIDILARSAVLTFSGEGIYQKITISQAPQIHTYYISIYHTNTFFEVPLISATDLTGIVSWGDGQCERWQNGLNSHEYSAKGEVVTTVDLSGRRNAIKVHFPNLKGITEIDFSGL